MAKIQYLTFEVHLQDATLVAQLQGTPPGETSKQGTAVNAIIRAPETGADVEFQTTDVHPLPLIGPKDTVPTTPYIYSEWFTDGNNFPRNVATFVRKSGGWFGIPWLFGTTVRFYWRGVFVYDAPQDSATGDAGGPRAAIAVRRWIDTFQLFEPTALDPGDGATEMSAFMSRDAARAVDGYGFAMRGLAGVRTRFLTGNHGGNAIVTPLAHESWERLYVRLRKVPTAAVTFWCCRNSISNQAGAVLQISPSGQIVVSNRNAAGTMALLGSTVALEIDRWYKLDLLVQYCLAAATSGQIQVYLNGEPALIGTVADSQGGMGQAAAHNTSEIGSPVAHTMEFDIGFWMNAQIPAQTPLTWNAQRADSNLPSITGLDWVNGSRGVLIRPSGMSADNADWSTNWRLLMQRPARFDWSLCEGALSTTAGAKLAVTTDAAQSVEGVPGSLGCVAFYVALFSWRGTTSGTLGYKLPPAAAILGAIIQREATYIGWNGVMVSVSGLLSPAALTGLELQHVKGADTTSSKVACLMASAELIGTFGDEDYPPTVPVDLRDPLPFLGIHNAPYPRTPWARTVSPPFVPVVIKSGTYAGNSTGQELTFRAPVHWLWIRRVTVSANSPKTIRWWSSKLGASQKDEESPKSWNVPDQLIDPTFVVTPAGGVPTGTGALPDRADQVVTLVAANIGLLDGTNENKLELLKLICRALNADNAGDGNNWGILQKPAGVVPTDILVWKPTLVHVDVLSDTGPMWNVIGVIDSTWSWLAVDAEGAQEQQTIVRIAGADIEVNQTGQTYVYVAIADPGQRYMLNGASAHVTANIAGLVHALIDTGFTPIWGWFQNEHPNNGSGVDMMAIKGPGNAAAALTKLSGSQLASAVTFGAGTLTLGADAMFGATEVGLNFSLFRMIEPGSVDPGRFDVVRVTTYTGNGAGGTRSIALPNPSGKRPLWVIVQPNTALGYFKDASHAGGNSTKLSDGSQLTTAIVTGAPDEITVGTTLNTNAVVYNVFVIMGGTAAGAAGDGFSEHGEFIPVEPTSPGGSQWGLDAEEPEPPEEPPGPGPGPGAGGGDTPGAPGGGADDILSDLEAACLPYTKRVFDDALSRIGISKRTVDPGTDNTEEAECLRLHYARALEQTLRDFPWPFATRYAALTLLSGTIAAPMNDDWTYSYRRPVDCVFERRIVVLRTGAVNPTPPPFQLSFDDTGGRIFTNQASAVLEYTARPECTAAQGDPLFLDAFVWKLAARIAGPLTRIADVVKVCESEYQNAINRATLVLRPGNPGVRTVLDPDGLDPTAAATAANLAAVNRALIRIGARTVANLSTEQSREADAVRVLFEDELRSTLRDHPWAFATKYDTDLVPIDGTADDPVNDDWCFTYRLPADCVFVRRIVPATGRVFDADPIPFRMGQDDTGALLYTNLENTAKDVAIEYTARIPSAVACADALFRDAFAWRLAASLAPSLAQVDPAAVEQLGRGPQVDPKERKATETQLRGAAARFAWQMYGVAIAKAQYADVREQQQEKPGDAEWITGRN
jgi:hypothetical protein